MHPETKHDLLTSQAASTKRNGMMKAAGQVSKMIKIKTFAKLSP
jgi:hypothetical protein